ARLAQFAGAAVAHQRRGQPVGLGGVLEAPAALVAVPLLVHRRVVPGEAAQHLAPAVVRALRAPGRAVLADARRGGKVERAGPEPVLLTGERADRADLHRVAGEVGVERLTRGDADLLVGRALHQVDELVAGDLLREPGAALAQHAALPVEQHLGRDVDR